MNMCRYCNKTFVDKSTLAKHVKIHTKKNIFKCLTCNRRFVQKSSLDSHFKLHTKIGLYECDYCQKKFTTKYNLITHIRKHTKTNIYNCYICSKEYAVLSAYQKHLQSHSNKKPYKCEICGARYSDKYCLKVHSSIHLNDKTFTCEVCGNRFNKKSILIRHLAIHKNEKTYQCEVCKKTFLHKYQLSSHSITHTNNLFLCHYCGKGLRRKGTLKVHLMKFHRDVTVNCNDNYTKEIYKVVENKTDINVSTNTDVEMTTPVKESSKHTSAFSLKQNNRNNCGNYNINENDNNDSNKITELKIATFSVKCDIIKIEPGLINEIDSYYRDNNEYFNNSKIDEEETKSEINSNFNKTELNLFNEDPTTEDNKINFKEIQNNTSINLESTTEIKELKIEDSFNTNSSKINELTEITRVNNMVTDSKTEDNKINLRLKKLKDLIIEETKLSNINSDANLKNKSNSKHVNINKFQCNECGKIYKHKNTLINHMRLHTDKVIKCLICEKVFTVINKYEIHKLTHLGVSPYFCILCDQKFTSNNSLKAHYQKHFDIKLHECLECKKK